jgi:tetratricopeptide (TPR) repeat protein
VYWNLGNYNAGQMNYKKALEMQWHVYSENPMNTDLASTLYYLGNVYLGLGNYNAACTNYKKALKMKRHVYGENAKNTD